MKKKKFFKLFLFFSLLIFFSGTGLVTQAAGGSIENSGNIINALIWVAFLLFAAKSASLVEKVGQPAVLGELTIGIIIGNLTLLGIGLFESVKANPFVAFLSELGVIILLFQVGLESNIAQMKKVGIRAFLVALAGVITPFILGAYVIGPLLFPGMHNNVYLFLGATLTATSVGITARVFKDLNKLKTPEAQIVLGAAVIDDVIGLVILAVVSAIVTIGTISLGTMGFILFKAIAFLAGAIIIGQLTAPYFGKILSKINTGIGMKFTLAISFALIFSYTAGKIGLAPIIGAFAAGLILDPVHFKWFKNPEITSEIIKHSKVLPYKHKEELKKIAHSYSEKHVEDLIEPLAFFLVPIFFVTTGMNVNLNVLANPKIIIIALAITLAAIAGKYAAGFFAGKVNKHIVGFGMVPRGEVGLIFAAIGSQLGVINNEIFSVIVIVVILTTLVTPPVLNYLLKKQAKSNQEMVIAPLINEIRSR